MNRLEKFWKKCGVRVRITSAAKSRIASSAEFLPDHTHILTEITEMLQEQTANEHVQILIDAGPSLQVCNHILQHG